MRNLFVSLRRATVVGLAAAGVVATSGVAASAAVGAPDTQPPTRPHLFVIRGLGGCELDMLIGLSTDNVTAQRDIRYQVLSNGVPVPNTTERADTRGFRPGSGALDEFVNPSPAAQSFSIRAIDLAGNISAPSNAISRTVSGHC